MLEVEKEFMTGNAKKIFKIKSTKLNQTNLLLTSKKDLNAFIQMTP